MHINYKHFVIGGLALNFMLAMSPSQAAKQRMVCPSDGKRPMFNVICPGGEEPIPIEEYNESRPPAVTGSKSRRNCSRMPNGKVSAECDSPVIVTKTSRQAFEPEMVDIPAGSFKMGSPSNEEGRDDEEGPVHTVHVKAFQMGKYEVTQGEWQAVMGNNPSVFSNCGERCPVENVSWNYVQDYITKLNVKTGRTYRLPTEAEWEYAARAGTNTKYWWGNEIGKNNANCHGCGSQWDNSKTLPVGSFEPNPWGLYDTAGNVWEWTCSDYTNTYDGNETTCNNHANSSRVVRGGSWGTSPRWLRSADRDGFTAAFCFDLLGFRLIRD